LAVAALTAGGVMLLPRWYQASATLVPAPKGGLSLDFTGLGLGLGAGGGSVSLSGQPTPQDQLKMVVTSRAVADTLVDRFDLVRRWNLERRDQARTELAERTMITTPREGQVVVAVEARSPVLARDLAAAYVRATGSEAARLSSSLAAQRRYYLSARLAELEREITVASEAVRAFEESHGAVALPEQTRGAMDAASALQAQVALLQTELAAARSYYTDGSTQVTLLRERVAELKHQIDRISRTGGALMPKANALPELKQEYVRLSREQQSLTAVSELLRRSYEQARVEESNPVPTFSVLDAAELPERHSRPHRAVTVALVLGLAMAASMADLQWKEWKSARASAIAGARDDVLEEAA
jgi:uncharacterized protein involved in exopolysaccharide biosynthesis